MLPLYGRWMPPRCAWTLAVLRLGTGTVFRLHRIVHLNGRTVAQPEHSGADNLIAGIDAGNDGDLIAARALDFHNLLPHSTIGVPFRVLHVGDHKYRVTVGRIVDG